MQAQRRLRARDPAEDQLHARRQGDRGGEPTASCSQEPKGFRTRRLLPLAAPEPQQQGQGAASGGGVGGHWRSHLILVSSERHEETEPGTDQKVWVPRGHPGHTGRLVAPAGPRGARSPPTRSACWSRGGPKALALLSQERRPQPCSVGRTEEQALALWPAHILRVGLGWPRAEHMSPCRQQRRRRDSKCLLWRREFPASYWDPRLLPGAAGRWAGGQVGGQQDPTLLCIGGPGPRFGREGLV